MSRAVQVDFLLAGVIDNSGNMLSGGKVYSYECGTTTAKSLYTDQAKTTPAANPVVLDSYGRAQVYADGSYKFIVKTSAGATLFTLDNLLYTAYEDVATYVALSTGSAGAYAISTATGISALAAGQRYTFITNHANTGAATLNVDNLGAVAIKRNDGSTALAANDILASSLVDVIYNGTYFCLMTDPRGTANALAARTNLGAAASGLNTDIYTILYDGGDVRFGTKSAHDIIFITNNANKFYYSHSLAALLPLTTNTIDIGSGLGAYKNIYTRNLTGETNQDLTIAVVGDKTLNFYTSSGSNRTSTFTNTGALHNIKVSGEVICADKNFTTGLECSWKASAVQSACFSASSSDNFYTDFLNPGSADHFVKVNGTQLSVPFTGVHRYEIHSDNTADVGEPVRLINGKVHHCEIADDPACIGILTGEVLIISVPDEKEDESETAKTTKISKAKEENHKKLNTIKSAKVNLHPSISGKTSFDTEVTDGGVICHVAACGDTVYADMKGAKVCDEGGAVEAGDYLSTASKKGYLKKYVPQTINDMRKCVAYAPEAIEFKQGINDKAYLYLMR